MDPRKGFSYSNPEFGFDRRDRLDFCTVGATSIRDTI
jgi:hypothetical protein